MPNPEFVTYVVGGCLLYLAGIATYLSVRSREDWPPPAASYILGFLCAIAGGFSTHFIFGQLGLNFEVPLTNIRGDAAGGIGVVVLVLLLWFIYDHRARAAKAKAEQDARERVRLEAERIAKAEAARLEAERIAKAEAARLEAERIAKAEVTKRQAEQQQKEAAARSHDVLIGRRQH